MSVQPSPTSRRRLLLADQVIDGCGISHCPGAILLREVKTQPDADASAATPPEPQRETVETIIEAVGSPQQVGRFGDFSVESWSGHVLIPALVNAHAHLDLTHIGCRPCDDPGSMSFTKWVGMIRSGRATTTEEIAGSVSRGIALTRAGGTAIIGDIAGQAPQVGQSVSRDVSSRKGSISRAAKVGGSSSVDPSLIPASVLRKSGMFGVSYLEIFGIGRRQQRAIEKMERLLDECSHIEGSVRIGLQPHAPYSCGREVYAAAAATGRPLATHLAETEEELRFVRSADGPLADMLRTIGVWDDSITPEAFAGDHPIDHLADVLSSSPFVAAHLNYVDDRHLELLAAWPISVAYCPRASMYFGHDSRESRRHRYLEMLDTGVNVALGTDSIVCLDRDDCISVLDEMRLLYARDSTDPQALLAMATVNGARALGVDPALVALTPGPTAGILALPTGPDNHATPLLSALHRDDRPTWVTGVD